MAEPNQTPTSELAAIERDQDSFHRSPGVQARRGRGMQDDGQVRFADDVFRAWPGREVFVAHHCFRVFLKMTQPVRIFRERYQKLNKKSSHVAVNILG